MSTPPLRLVRLAPDPLGLYVRAGRLDQKDLQSFITSGAAAFTGVVFEAKRVAQQQELLSLVLERGLDAVLDPQTQAMAGISSTSALSRSPVWDKSLSRSVRPNSRKNICVLRVMPHWSPPSCRCLKTLH